MEHDAHQRSSGEQPEEVIFALPDHWITVIKQFFVYVFSLILFVVLLIVSLTYFSAASSSRDFFFITSVVGLVAVHHFLFIYIFHWQLSDVIITTKRIIDLDVMPYVRNDSMVIDLHTISEIHKMRHGIIQNIFNYGTIKLILLGTTKEIKLRDVKQPSKLANFLEAYKNGSLSRYSVNELRQLYHSEERFE